MFRLLQMIALLGLCATAHAMNVSGYELLVKQSQSSSPGDLIAEGFIEAYFTGVAETLQFLKGNSQNIYMFNAPMLCFPSDINLTGLLLRGVLDGELQNPTRYKELFGPQWKEHHLTGIIIWGLRRMFPCLK